jgi:hypothetical protein
MRDARKIDEFSIFGVLRPQTLLQKVIGTCQTIFLIYGMLWWARN